MGQGVNSRQFSGPQVEILLEEGDMFRLYPCYHYSCEALLPNLLRDEAMEKVLLLISYM